MSTNPRSMFLAGLLLTLQLCAHAQTNYQPGSVTLNDGQQITGWIDYRPSNQTPRKISFKKTQDGQLAQYAVADLQSFIVNGIDSFERAIVMKDMRQVEYSNINVTVPNTDQRDTAFLRVLLKTPKADVYELVDTKLHLYVRENKGECIELQYRVYFNSETSVITYQTIFRNQLMKFTEGHPQANKWKVYAERMRYASRDLVTFMAGVNDVKVKHGKTTVLNLFAGAGAVYSNLKLGGNTTLDRLSYKGSVGPSIGLGVDLRSLKGLNRVLFRLELFYSSNSYEAKDDKPVSYPVIYKIKVNSVTPAVAALYNFVNNPSFKLYAGGGIGYNISSYPTNRYHSSDGNGGLVYEQDNYIVFNKNWAEFNGRVGAFIFDKVEAGFLAKLVGNFNTDGMVSGSPSTYTFRVNYHFGKK